MLIIDDFGRQRSSPTEILNRWIVPLESRVDHLVLQSGQKFEIPFEVLIVFSTNLNPLDLLDESFLRRIRYRCTLSLRRQTISSRSSSDAVRNAVCPSLARWRKL